MKNVIVNIYGPSKKLILLFLLFYSVTTVSQQPVSSIAKNDTVTLISSQFSFTEGPTVDKEGNIFFTDQPNNKIWKYDVQGNLSVFLDSAGRSNGMYFDSKGNLITCADEKNELWQISPERKITVLLKNFKGHQFNGPNDLWVDDKDGIYFTDPYYQRDYWQRKSPDPGIHGENLYYLPKGSSKALLVDSNLKNQMVLQVQKIIYLCLI